MQLKVSQDHTAVRYGQVSDMLDFCVKNIPNITFKFVPAEELQNIRRKHEKYRSIELMLIQKPSLTIN